MCIMSVYLSLTFAPSRYTCFSIVFQSYYHWSIDLNSSHRQSIIIQYFSSSLYQWIEIISRNPGRQSINGSKLNAVAMATVNWLEIEGKLELSFRSIESYFSEIMNGKIMKCGYWNECIRNYSNSRKLVCKLSRALKVNCLLHVKCFQTFQKICSKIWEKTI